MASLMPSSSSKMAAGILVLGLIVISFPACLAAAHSVVLDDLAGRRTITIHIGDYITFKRSHLQNAYLFHSRRTFEFCNFTDAALIFHGGSAQIKWFPPLPGWYYFSTKNDSAPSCKKGKELLVVRVIPPELSPTSSPEAAPPPTAGGDLPSSPSIGWWSSGGSPLPPPSLAPEASPPEPGEHDDSSSSAPENTSEGIPFINSNPAVPLPTGETDTAAVLRPFPTADGATQPMGQGSSERVHMLHVAITAILSCILCIKL